jgi:hypothetical protein
MEQTSVLSERIRQSLGERGEVIEGSFMGGTSFWLDDRLAIAIHGDDVLVRVPDAVYPSLMERSGARPYEFAARPVPNWVLFAGEAADEDALAELIGLGLDAAG